MKNNATFQMVEIAKRIAADYGTTAEEVLDRWGRGLRRSAYSKRDFFWTDSDISPSAKKIDRRFAVARLLTGCGTAAR